MTTELESRLRNRLRDRPILLMTHVVLGYPSFEDGFGIIERMVGAGVDLMELQIPFSEPIADGPIILRANQRALERGANVRQCLEFSRRVVKAFDIPFIFMSYYNILYQFGVARFAAAMADIGLKGIIVPDLPPEESADHLQAAEANRIAPVFIFSPRTSQERMRTIASRAGGFIYCVARTGVTGSRTEFAGELEQYLARCRRATELPLALGFGVKRREDIDYLRGKVDIAVVGTETIRIVEEKGIEAVSGFIGGLLAK